MIDPEFSKYYNETEDKALFIRIYNQVVATWDDTPQQSNYNRPVTVTSLMPEITKRKFNLKEGDSFQSRAALAKTHNVFPSLVTMWYKKNWITLG